MLFFIPEFTLGMILPTKATGGQEMATERKLSGHTMQVRWLCVLKLKFTIDVAPPAFAMVTTVTTCKSERLWGGTLFSLL